MRLRRRAMARRRQRHANFVVIYKWPYFLQQLGSAFSIAAETGCHLPCQLTSLRSIS
jgi:hypothetical protein